MFTPNNRCKTLILFKFYVKSIVVIIGLRAKIILKNNFVRCRGTCPLRGDSTLNKPILIFAANNNNAEIFSERYTHTYVKSEKYLSDFTLLENIGGG